jgi:hypothetical protein
MKANDCPKEYAIDVLNEVMLLVMFYMLFWFLDGGLINGTDNKISLPSQIKFINYTDFVFLSLGFFIVFTNIFYVFLLMIKGLQL